MAIWKWPMVTHMCGMWPTVEFLIWPCWHQCFFSLFNPLAIVKGIEACKFQVKTTNSKWCLEGWWGDDVGFHILPIPISRCLQKHDFELVGVGVVFGFRNQFIFCPFELFALEIEALTMAEGDKISIWGTGLWSGKEPKIFLVHGSPYHLPSSNISYMYK